MPGIQVRWSMLVFYKLPALEYQETVRSLSTWYFLSVIACAHHEQDEITGPIEQVIIIHSNNHDALSQKPIWHFLHGELHSPFGHLFHPHDILKSWHRLVFTVCVLISKIIAVIWAIKHYMRLRIDAFPSTKRWFSYNSENVPALITRDILYVYYHYYMLKWSELIGLS